MGNKIGAIDCWAGVLPPEQTKNWPPQFIHIFNRYRKPEKMYKGFTPEEMIQEMDEAGVEKVILSAFVYKEMKVDNDYIAKVCDQFPDRCIGCGTVDPRDGMKAVREVERIVNDLHMKAIKLEPYAYGDEIVGLPPNHKYYYPIYAKCVELDIPVTIQIGHTGPLLPSECARPIYLDEVALFFPELRIIGGHLGQPWHEEMMILAWKFPNVYVDSSARAPKYWPESFKLYAATWGQDNVLWGTDYPLLTFKRCIDEIEQLGLSEQAKRKILRDNAIKVFKL
ncbi:MAG: amidohydrolase family protein [Candidatus Jordarchaeum sp.]|uniref:amidohydrolase family protein n=1 Tax=Candidatus Jordarchaeum sp. TaxID=2823881 RepID=UPI00404A1AA2